MTPEHARIYAQEVIDANDQINASYVANGTMTKAAVMAQVVIDLANQLEAAQTELVTLKREAAYVAEPAEVLPATGDRDADRDGRPEWPVRADRSALPEGV